MSLCKESAKILLKEKAGRWLMFLALLLTAGVYWPGLFGNFLFDDFPNIVDNQGVQPHQASLASLINAALSSPASDFKRPLASLSFAINYLLTGLNPYWMKLTNLLLHLMNGWLVYTLAFLFLRIASDQHEKAYADVSAKASKKKTLPPNTIAALIAAGWMLLPINLTSVLYVVQRMESMANLFVLLGLIGYVLARRSMLERASSWYGFILCALSITVPVAVGILAKETAVMLPLYTILVEWILFRFKTKNGASDCRIVALFVLVLFLPMIAGLAWLTPRVLNPSSWATRNFTLNTRLLSEARIVVDYIQWTWLPTPRALSFYHDDFEVSKTLLSPWTTLASLLLLSGLATLATWLRTRLPLVSLGILLFLGAQLLTGTIMPLELIYEHRNYFASFGLLLALVPLLTVPFDFSFALPRWLFLGGLMAYWCSLTALTAFNWGNPLLLAEDLATRAPDSPRAQYELGRIYIIYSHYDPTSVFTKKAYAPLERSAALPGSSILPEQALIFLNARMQLPLKQAWWDSLITKLKANKPTVQDESSLGALTQCNREGLCDLPRSKMMEAYLAALAHPNPSARLLAMYSDYAWNVLHDEPLGLRMADASAKADPSEPAYRITFTRMLIASGQLDRAQNELTELQKFNIGGRLDSDINQLRVAIQNAASPHY